MTRKSQAAQTGAVDNGTSLPPASGKSIVVFSDGTGNSAAKLFKTNVWRLYQALETQNGKQVACYDDGVGTSSFRPLAALGGAMGFGLARNVKSLYAFICRNYQPGDRIYAFGFSRGAFTIRVLLGLIQSQGILKKDQFFSDRHLDQQVAWAYRRYREKYATIESLSFLVRRVRDAFLRGWQGPHSLAPVEIYPSSISGDDAEGVTVAFAGLWDTVDAYGLPIDELTIGWDKWVWPLLMRDTTVWPGVRKICHALALDDERNTFHPRIINEENNAQMADGSLRIEQVWFPGMHSDVGGGYPKDGLSYVTLKWMMSRAMQYGLALNSTQLRDLVSRADHLGHMNDSRGGLGLYYRYLPRRIDRMVTDEQHLPHFKPKLHASVINRIRESNGNYAPIVIPRDYDVVDEEQFNYAHAVFVTPKATPPLETAEQRHYRDMQQQQTFDHVWFRRVAYFATLILTALLVLMPWINGSSSKCTDSAFCAVAGLPRVAGIFLPAFAQTWIDSFSANPGVFGLLAAGICALILLSRSLRRSIQAVQQSLWLGQSSGLRHWSPGFVTAVRENRLYRAFFRTLKHKLIPGAFGISVLLFVLFALPLIAVSRIDFAIKDAVGNYCDLSDPARLRFASSSQYVAARNAVDIRDRCAATGIQLQKGGTYEIALRTLQPNLSDDSYPADLRGNRSEMPFLLRFAGAPFKRFIAENYLVPIARIAHAGGSMNSSLLNPIGQDEYVLHPESPAPEDANLHTMLARIHAESTGELFIYVNDGILRWPIDQYCNNSGSILVKVRLVSDSVPHLDLPFPPMESYPLPAQKNLCK